MQSNELDSGYIVSLNLEIVNAKYLNLEIFVILHKKEGCRLYNSNNVADNIKKMAKSKNVTIKKLLEDVGLGFNTMTNMKTSMPKADNLAKIADYLDCSVDYLLGRTDCPDLIVTDKAGNTAFKSDH